MTALQIIKSESTANNFYFWLQEHPEVKKINGYELDRTTSNAVVSLRFDGGKNYHNFDIAYMWKERASLNDWIRTQL